MPTSELRLGIDVGGTNTDAVVLDADSHLVARAKVPTAADVHASTAAAISRVCGDPAVDVDRISRAMLGTTQATNAVLERRGLERVAVLRIGGPLTRAVPPLATWPADLRAAVSAGESVVAGGAEFDGRPLGALDERAIARFAESMAGSVRAVAVCGVFSPVAPADELAAAEVLRRELGAGVPVSLSHEIGGFGLLARENATVLNAALGGTVGRLAAGFAWALAKHGISAEPLFAQNDGSLMVLEHARRFPVLLIAGGPANSMRGAAYLSGYDEAVVIDVGGTSTEVGALVNGFPRRADAIEIGGVRMSFRTPDLRSLPLGGGSLVTGNPRRPQIGPRSVGADLVTESLAFGGRTPTLSDAAVAAGRMRIGTRAPQPARYPELAAALALAADVLADAVERVAVPGTRPSVIAVGGGAALVPDRLGGAFEVVRPVDGDVANAIGAAIAPVSGHAELICADRPDRRRDALEEARAAAFARAVHAGADPDAVEVVEIETVPLTYLVEPAVRIRVRAAGPWR